jgi:hypothetical protein
MGGSLDLLDKKSFEREEILDALAGDRALEDRRISKACFFVRTGSRRAG